MGKGVLPWMPNSVEEVELNTPLEFGLIGCGRAAELIYLPVFSRNEEFKLAAVADPIKERRELISSRIPGCRAFPSAESLIKKISVAGLIITTPPDTHIPLAITSLKAGLPALVEKPLALSMSGVEALTSVEASSKDFIMVGFNRRYWEPVQRLKKILSDRRNSDRIFIEMKMVSDIDVWSPICGSIDPIDDLGSHQFDLLRYLLDCDILALNARRIDAKSVTMQIRLEGDILADCSVAYANKSQESITVRCGQRRYLISLGSERLKPAGGFIRHIFDLSEKGLRRLRGLQSSLSLSYDKQLISFANFIHTETIKKPSIAEGIAAIRAAQAAKRSIENGSVEVSL